MLKHHMRVTANTCQVLNLNQAPKRSQRLAVSQTFCHTWWSKKLPDGIILRNVVAEEWVVEYKKRPTYNAALPIPRIPVTFINAVTKHVFAIQLKEIQETIFAKHEALKVPSEDEEVEDNADDDAARAWDFQIGLDSLPYSLDQAGQQILEHTGFISLTMVAGPDPSQGGNILAYSLTEGKTSNGCDFTQYIKNYRKTFQVPFTEFAKLVFPPEEHMRCALPGTEHLCDYNIPTAAPESNAAPVSTPAPPLSAAASSSNHDAHLELIEDNSDAEEIPNEAEATSNITDAAPARPLHSAYEIEREANIEHNKALLVSLGLDKPPVFGGKKPRTRAPKSTKDAAEPVRCFTRLTSGETEASAPFVDLTEDKIVGAPAEASEDDAVVPVPTEAIKDNTPAPTDTIEKANAPTLPAEADKLATTATSDGLASSGATPNTTEADALRDTGTDEVVPMDVDVVIACPFNAPDWLKSVVPYLAQHSKDPRWFSVIGCFIDFERSLGFLDGKLANHMLAIGKNRPKEMSVWVKNARNVEPNIKNAVTFG
ncbi:hypothetical protein PTI98_000700 [Pleurotus ostreatus]|nr:hypothetical protein PTI98_000700 [Pleurotus ostreatus]